MKELFICMIAMVLVVLIGAAACAYILYKSWKEDRLNYGKNND